MGHRCVNECYVCFLFFSSRRRHTRSLCDWSSDVCSSDLTPGTGMNFLVHNMCRLPGSDGTWMIVRGGMGTVTRLIADAARQAGAKIETGKKEIGRASCRERV